MMRGFGRARAILLVVMLAVSSSAWAQSSLPDLSLEDLMKLDAGQVFGASERLQPVTRGARLGLLHHRGGDRAVRLPHACGHPARRPRDVRDQRSQLQSHRDARVRQAGGLQQPHPAAGQRTPRERQRLRAGGDRRGVRPRSGDVRACRNHPRARLVALWRQRVLRGGERDHADGRLARRRLDYARDRHAGDPAGAGHRGAPLRERRGRGAVGHLRAQRWRRTALLSGVRCAGHQQRRGGGARRRRRQTVLRPSGLQRPDRDRRVWKPAAGRADRLVRDGVQRAGPARSRRPIVTRWSMRSTGARSAARA